MKHLFLKFRISMWYNIGTINVSIMNNVNIHVITYLKYNKIICYSQLHDLLL